MFFIKLQIVNYLLAFLWISTTINAFDWDCAVEANKTITVDNGWPFKLSCDEALFYMESEEEILRTECYISDEDQDVILLNKTVDLFLDNPFESYPEYRVSEKFMNTSTNYKIIMKIIYFNYSICSATNVFVKVIKFVQETCQQAINRSNLMPSDAEEGRQKNFFCHDIDQNIEYESVEESNETVSSSMKFSWLKNCEQIENANKNQYKVMRVSFDHPGVYTCAATYRNMTKFVSHYKVCVKHFDHIAEPTIICRKNIEASLGYSFNLTLTTQLGVGSTSTFTTFSSWYKLSEKTSKLKLICENQAADTKRESEVDENISCSFITNTEKSKTQDQCFSKPPSEEMRQPDKIIHHPQLFFKKLKKSDFGFYEFQIFRIGHPKPKKCRIHLKQTSLQPKQQFTNRLIASICSLLLVIFLIILGVYYRIFIKICIKRSFIQSSINSCKVFLFYRYSNEMNEEDQKMVKESVHSIDSHLKRFGCDTFDENRDGRPSLNTSEDLEAIISGCDRVVLLLISKDFIEDNWSIFKLQKSFEKSMDKKSKLIFILGPGMRKMIKDSASSNDTCFFIQRAMKMSHVIEWSVQRMKTQRFIYELELAIPKIQSKKIEEQTQQVEAQI